MNGNIARSDTGLQAAGVARSIARLGGPLIGFFFVQTLSNLACLAILGRLGNAALAGVGAASVIYGVVLALLFGVDTAVQATISRATGAGQAMRWGPILTDALAVSAPLGAGLGVLVWTFGPALAARMLPDPGAASAGAAYLRAIAPSLLFLALTTPVNAVWIGSGRPGRAFAVTVALAPVQILLTALLVLGAGPIAGRGAEGAGLSGALVPLIGVGLQAVLALRPGGIEGLGRSRPRPSGMASIIAIGWPVSLQQALSQFGFVIGFVIVAQLGVRSAAAINVLVSLTTLPVQTAVGLGVAAATLVGQALGRGDPDEARRWGWRTSLAGAAVTAPLGLIALAAPRALLSLFLHDPQTLALAIVPARILGAMVGLDSIGQILSFALRGAAATKLAAGVPFVLHWLIQLPLTWWIGLKLGLGLPGIIGLQAALAILQATLFAAIWSGGSWTRARLAPALATMPALALPERPQRIAVLGGGGAGKSTLARRLGETLELPVVHLDRLVFGPGWRREAPATVRARLAEPLAGDAWIVDGTYLEASDLTLPQADLVLWIDQPAWRRLWRAWRKTRIHRNRARLDRPDGCAEGFTRRYALDILAFGAWSARLERRLTEAAGRPPIRLRGDAAIAALVAGLRRE
jgi:putative MATE family efflux protein